VSAAPTIEILKFLRLLGCDEKALVARHQPTLGESTGSAVLREKVLSRAIQVGQASDSYRLFGTSLQATTCGRHRL
jgi:hypothetical protein